MRTTLKQTIASAWMLLAALAIGTASCSQSEDTPDAPNGATGNEPISISIAPKPGFQAGDAQTRSIIQAEAQTRSNDAQTRSTVTDGTGAFAWEDTDKVYVLLTFSFADGTTAPLVKEQRWAKSDSPNTNTPVAGWNVYEGWDANALVSTPITWPLGASKCQVQAFYTNCGYSVASDKNSLTNFTYANSGQGDHMIFNGTFSVGETLAVNFAHSTTRVTFKGLKANTTYTLKLNDDADQLPMPTSFKKEGFAFGDYAPQPFTTDKNGTFTRCLPLTSHIDATSGEVKINVFTDDGTTPITEGTLKAVKDTDGAWKTNGLQYIMTAKDFAGDMNPDNDPDLLPPPPVQPGATVHTLNGYYVTAAPDGKWATITTDSTNPCKLAGNGWRLPTMKDFETMAGWGTSNNPWNSKVNNTNIALGAGTDAAAFNAAFPDSGATFYWSSEENTSSILNAWGLQVSTGAARYQTNIKDYNRPVRCVQKK